MKFAVTVISPPGYAHSAAFHEVAESVHHALLALGHDSVITQKTDCPGRQHIVLGSCTLPHYPQELAPGSILYNLEQISPDSPWLTPDLMALFRRFALWDYSLRNIEQFRRMGIDGVAHVPLGYVPQLTRIDPAGEDIDVLFIGSMNERRLAIIEALREHGVRAEWRFGLYGAERDRLIARARIMLNVHYYEAKIFEAVRVSYLLANKRFVISERGSSPEEDEDFASGVAFAAYDDLVDMCVDYLARPERRAEIAAAGFAMMRGRPQAALLEPALRTLAESHPEDAPVTLWDRRLPAGPALPGLSPARQEPLTEVQHGDAALTVTDQENGHEMATTEEPACPRVSVVMPVFNHADLTASCLTSLVETTDECGVTLELIVVDNASTDQTPALLATLVEGDVTVLRNEVNRGFGEACNQGAAVARGEYILFLNNDTVLLPGWLPPLVAALDEDPSRAAVQPRLIYPDGRLNDAGGLVFRNGDAWVYGKGAQILDAPQYATRRAPDYVTGACMLIRRSAFEEVGGFDPRYAPAYYEDTDLSFALRAAGWALLYEPASTIVHLEGGTAGTDVTSGLKQYQVRNKGVFARKWEADLSRRPDLDPAIVDTWAHRGQGGWGPGEDATLRGPATQARTILSIDPFPPLWDRAGGGLRTMQLLQSLREEGHVVVHVAAANAPERARYAAALSRIGVPLYGVDPADTPDDPVERVLLKSAYLPDLTTLVQRHRPDVVLVAPWGTAEYLIDPLRTLLPTAAIVVDTCDVHFVRERRTAELAGDAALARQAEANRERELAVYAKADRIVCASAEDAAAVREAISGCDVVVAGLAHDTVDPGPGFDERGGLLFVGNANHPPNQDAVTWWRTEIAPRLAARLPGVRLTVAGNDPNGAMRALAANSDHIQALGWVPETLPYLHAARLSVAPLRVGAGVKIKVGEALMAGLPVVCTSIAAEGLDLVDGQHALMADDPDAFVEQIVRAYTDPALWEHLRANGLSHAHAHLGRAKLRAAVSAIVAPRGTTVQPSAPGTDPHRPLVQDQGASFDLAVRAYSDTPLQPTAVGRGLPPGFLRSGEGSRRLLAVPSNERALPHRDAHEAPPRQASSGRAAAERPSDSSEEETLSDSPADPVRTLTRPRTIAFYLPQFHPVPENDTAWGAGFTEWTNVVRARPLFEGHHQPHLPADLGFYDLRLPEARQAQAELARRFGVDGFCYYHYWFHGRRLLNRPLDEMLASGKPDFPFMLCWANEDWRSRWDGRSGEVLQQQAYSREDDEAHIAFLLDVFRDPRYIRVDGKPVFLVYRAASLPDPLATTALWRERAREAGIGELLLCRVESGFHVENGDPREIGFDAAIGFQPDWDSLGDSDRRHLPRMVFDYAQVADKAMSRPRADYPRFNCVTPRWDNTPRRADNPVILADATPDRYQRWLAHTVRSTDSNGLVFVNAWNEWGEGAHLEPDTEFGLSFLDAHAAALYGMAGGATTETRESILDHRRALRGLEADAERRLAVHDVEGALRLASVAADWAWYNHTGLFVSHRLESIARAAGRRLLADLSAWQPTPDRKRRVLHVITEAHTVGGHTRLAWRWMTNDATSEHSVVLTRQGNTALPDELIAATDGRLYRLTAPATTEQVVELATLMRQFDLVILHIHPFDVVAVAACADAAKRPPTLLVNHADHVFWLGVSAADAIMEGRPSGEALTTSRRGVASDRCVRLPLPLDRTRRTLDRAEAKRRVGLSPDAVVLLTIAAPHKFAPAGRAVFSDLAARLLADHGDAHLIAVGPTAETPGWAALAAAPGRVHALGYRTDIQAFLEAADVYLDSFPFTSPTSLLEAAQLDTPVVAFAGEPAADALTARDFVEPSLVAASAEEWLALAGTLIGDAEARRVQGQRLGERVRSAHAAPGWNQQLTATYAQVRHGAAEPPLPVSEVLTPMDDLLYLLHEHGGMSRTLSAVLAAHGLSTPAAQGEARAANTETASLSVVVLARNGVAMTIVCLQALLDACAPYGQIDVTVVDHATTDTTREVLATLADAVRIIRVDDPASPERLLWATGAANARSDRVLLLTHDVELDAASVERLRGALAGGPGPVGYLGSLDAPGSTCLLYRRAQLTGKVWPSPRYIPIDEEEEVA